MSGLVEWLLEQIDEDERTARSCPQPRNRWRRGQWDEEEGFVGSPDDGHLYSVDGDRTDVVVYDEGTPCGEEFAHIARWDPPRVLAECTAKRRIVEQHTPAWDIDPNAFRVIDWVVRTLALPYADRPGYQPEWRP